MGELLVRGQAEGRLSPSHAVLQVMVQAREPSSQDAALARAAQACALVDEVVQRGRGGATPLVRTAETSSIRTAEDWEYGSGGHRRRVGWLAERGTRIECVPDADGLTALVRDLTHDDVRLSGPSWHVAPDAPGWDTLRSAAMADARQRAAAYAAGVAAQVGAVRWIAEPGLRREPGGQAPDFATAEMRVAAPTAAHGGEPSEPLPVRIAVEPVAVSITVEAAFDLG